ncbi:antibiotic biosynthesis monooxygenase [Nocardiopsis sp. RSe5-2]|uniref:Antibiotic biosynthesis monooxygenase n=1 Tax=Nocardiopsis endophytica TaxID=3018445 RepID=A0ABT4U7Q3_9ACTN|nr:antibiotic biosynthesis monooxygenase [Nocardiopsis endophytica]MDA2812979.1 antibiotic biosynthesis monooxygenase [Nocardiopsis endophytica]
MVMVSARVKPGCEEAFEKAFETVRAQVKGTDGHLGDRLVRDRDSGRYILVGEWESAEKFASWEDAPVHREMTVPMREYWDGGVERTVFEVVSEPSPAAT